ncbi:MAG: hypothetical protein ACSHX7_08085 [Luteolibacter sp.]
MTAVSIVEWNAGGHHDTYLRVYASVLLNKGLKVNVLCREPEAVEKWLEERHGKGCVRVVGIPGPEWVRERRKWPFGLGFRAYGMMLRKRLEVLENGERSEVYFSCLYEHQVRILAGVIRRLGGRFWSGFYMHPHSFYFPGKQAPGVKKKWPISRLWGLAGFRGLTMLDECVAADVEEVVGVAVCVLPDIADDSVDGGSVLTKELQDAGRGRKVIGLMGHLVPSKGVIALARRAKTDVSGRLLYAFVGEIHWEMFSEKEREVLKELSGMGDHVWVYDARVCDEGSYNALLKNCDVLYAAYEKFPHSSNTLTKAAIFEKPVIVSDGFLMAARVRRYGIGVVLPEGWGDDELLKAIEGSLSEDKGRGFKGYREMHSMKKLEERLGGFFGAEGV